MEYVVVQLFNRAQISAIPWVATRQASLSFTVSRSLLKLMSIKSVMPSNHLVLCRPLLLLPSIFPRIRLFSNKSALHIMWPKFWSFSFSICPSKEYSGLISFRIDWFDHLAVQGTLKSLLQHQSSKVKVAQPCPILCNPVGCSVPGSPVLHRLLEFTQIHVHWVGDAIQPPHSLSPPSPAFNLSEHQGLFQ